MAWAPTRGDGPFRGNGSSLAERACSVSPTARSLSHLRELGYRAQVVEKWNPFARVRQDLFGGDILALKSGNPILIVQATTSGNIAARIQKLQEHGFVDLWKSVGASLEVWGWAKQGPRGKRKTWQLRREPL